MKQPAKWSRRRGVMTVFASVAAAGFAAAAIAPAVSAVTTSPGAAGEARSQTTSTYELAREGAQTLDVDESVKTKDVSRSGYEVYVKPTPTPTPTPEPVVEEASSGASTFNPVYTGGGAPSDWMRAAGIADSDFGYVDYIVGRESGWNPSATNPSSGACGLVQAWPCSKVPGNGYDPVDNLVWGNGYAVGRYGSWANAVAFWSANNWW